jgi:hypothetical protein
MINRTVFYLLPFFLFTKILCNTLLLNLTGLHAFSQTINHTNANRISVANVTISGKVLSADGLGINLVKLSIISDVTQTVYTNSSGVYSVSVTTGKNYLIRLEKDKYLFTPVNITIDNVQNAISDLNFTAYPFYRIAGTIYDAAGQRVSNIKILLTGNNNIEKLTTIAGQFVFDSLVRGNYIITPSSTIYSFTPTLYTFSDLNNDAVPKNFVATIIPSYKISGYIKDETGNPVINADISLTGIKSLSVKSDVNGFYEFSGLTDGEYQIHVLSAGYAFSVNNKSAVIAGASVSNLNFTAQKSYSLSGAIKNKLNIPLSNVKLTLNGSKSASTYTDSQGLFFFDSILPGSYNITPELYSYVFSPGSLYFDITNSNLTGLNFNAEKLELFTISGKVMDKNGKGLKNVKVIVLGRAQFETFSLSDGSFVFTDIEKGNYILSLMLEGYTFSQRTINLNLDNNLENLNFEAFPFYKIYGYLTNNSGSALTNIKLILEGDSVQKYCFTDIAGKYLFDSLLTGNYTVTPKDTNYSFYPENIKILNLRKDILAENIVGRNSFKIDGRIADPLDRPLKNIAVSLFSTDTTTCFSDTNGYFSFKNISEGNIKLIFSSNGLLFDPPFIQYLPLSKNEIVISICGYITLSGEILSLKALPVSGIKILLQGNKSDSCTTKSDGSFYFDKLPFGKYGLSPHGNNYSFIPSQYKYDSLIDCKYFQSFTAISNITLSGRILDIKSQPVKNIKVALSNNSYIFTDSNGYFLFPDLSIGKYTLQPVDSTYKFYPDKLDCNVTAVGLNEQNFVAKKIINITGRITDYKDRPIESAKITNSKDTTCYTFSDSNGLFYFKNIESGIYSFSFFKSGYYFSPAGLDLDTISNSITDLNIKGYIKLCGVILDSTLNPIVKADLTLSGEMDKTVSTNDYGHYEITGLTFGNHHLKVTKTGYSFYPKQKDYLDLSASIETDTFFAHKLLSISGTIHDVKNRFLDNVILALTGDTTILLQSVNEFLITNLNPGKYLLTPLKTGVKFRPQNITFNSLNKDCDTLNFLGYITISGRITDSSENPKSGINVELLGELSSAVLTDKNGFYFFDSLCCGKYIITPINKNFSFKPESVVYQNLNCLTENLNFISSANTTGIIQKENILNYTALLNNFPNPFNSSTTIRFSIDKESLVTLSVIDILGREVSRIIDNKTLEANEYSVRWNGKDHSNLSSGIYIYVLQVKNGDSNKTFNKRMMMLK